MFFFTRLDEQPVQIIWHVFTSDEAAAELSRALFQVVPDLNQPLSSESQNSFKFCRFMANN